MSNILALLKQGAFPPVNAGRHQTGGRRRGSAQKLAAGEGIAHERR
jgi:hypothetical protein